MRTTLTLDDDVLEAARDIAAARGQSLGAVVSELARRSLKPATWQYVDGLPTFIVPGDSPGFTEEDVARGLDDE